MNMQRAARGFVSLILASCYSRRYWRPTASRPTWWHMPSSSREKRRRSDQDHPRHRPVDKKVGREAIPFDFATGDWDHVVYFPYDTARMDTIPPGAEWWKALAQQEGGPEQAQKLFQRYLDLEANSKFEIAKSPGPLKSEPNR